MRCYVVAYIDPKHKPSTRIDHDEGINPTWDVKLVLAVDEKLLSDVLTAITVEICCRNHIREKLAGITRILVFDLLSGEEPTNPLENPIHCIVVQARRPSAHPRGILNIWIPHTGRFLLHKTSLSFSRKDAQVTLLEQDAHNAGALEENGIGKKYNYATTPNYMQFMLLVSIYSYSRASLLHEASNAPAFSSHPSDQRKVVNSFARVWNTWQGRYYSTKERLSIPLPESGTLGKDDIILNPILLCFALILEEKIKC